MANAGILPPSAWTRRRQAVGRYYEAAQPRKAAAPLVASVPRHVARALASIRGERLRDDPPKPAAVKPALPAENEARRGARGSLRARGPDRGSPRVAAALSSLDPPDSLDSPEIQTAEIVEPSVEPERVPKSVESSDV